jgi:hypothetical protein
VASIGLLVSLLTSSSHIQYSSTIYQLHLCLTTISLLICIIKVLHHKSDPLLNPGYLQYKSSFECSAHKAKDFPIHPNDNVSIISTKHRISDQCPTFHGLLLRYHIGVALDSHTDFVSDQPVSPPPSPG